jgi:hypothetical protein
MQSYLRTVTYVLLPDTNIPFVIGELWLAEPTNGAPLTLLAEVDAGHGYSPIWSPDGSSLIYVHRENPDDIQADIEPLALQSNLQQVEISSGTVTTITQFSESLVLRHRLVARWQAGLHRQRHHLDLDTRRNPHPGQPTRYLPPPCLVSLTRPVKRKT